MAKFCPRSCWMHPNRRACTIQFFRFSFYSAQNISCYKQKISTCSFINLLKEGSLIYLVNYKWAGWHFFPILLIYKGLVVPNWLDLIFPYFYRNVESGQTVRLSGGQEVHTGYLEVKSGGQWNLVCNNDSSWDMQAATVACR